MGLPLGDAGVNEILAEHAVLKHLCYGAKRAQDIKAEG